MNEFERPTPLPSELRSLIEADRRMPGMSRDAKQRVLGRIGAGFLAGSVATVVATSTAKAGATAGAVTVGHFFARKGSIALAAFFLGGLGGALGIGVALKVGGGPAPSHSALTPTTVPIVASIVAGPVARPIDAPPPSTVTPAPSTPDGNDAPPLTTSVPPMAPAPLVAPALAVTATTATPSASSSHDADLASERMLIEMARSALAHGAPEQALAAVAKHQSKYPNGQLGEERESIAVHALVAAGRMDEARARAERFRKHYPKSLFLAGIDAAVGADP